MYNLFIETKIKWCRILGISSSELKESFNAEASESIKHPSRYARNFLEYCCFRTLALSTQVTGHLADKKFRRLTYDMMVAWEVPAVSSQPLVNVSSIISCWCSSEALFHQFCVINVFLSLTTFECRWSQPPSPCFELYSSYYWFNMLIP